MPFTDQDPIAPLENLLNQAVDEAVSTAGTNVDTLRPIRTFKWADEAERNAQVGMTAGDIGYQLDTNVVYKRTASAWVPIEPLTARQIDSTNDTVRTLRKYGFGKITGSGTSAMAELVTFPDGAFGSIPHVSVNFMGTRASSAFNMTGLNAASVPATAAQQTTTTTFQAYFFGANGTSFSNVLDWYYSWEAIGEAP